MTVARDPDYCVHGRSMDDPCFFCGRGNPDVQAAPARAATFEHRNPPAKDSGSRFNNRVTVAKPKRLRAARPSPAGPAAPLPAALPQVEPAPRATLPPSPHTPRPADPLARALRRLRSLERELKRVQDLIARTVADIAESTARRTP